MLKHLNLEEMVGLMRPWVKKTKRRATFLSIPEVAPLHGKVVSAHDAVLSVQPVKAQMPPELRKIVEEQAKVDATHDHLARFITLTFEAHREHCLAEDPPDVERAAKCDEINGKFFPIGMDIVNASYLAESGNTARVEQLMKAEAWIPAFLKTIPAPEKKTLLDVVQRWIGSGTRLEELEHDREEIEVAQATKPASPATIQAARSQWFEIVRTIIANLKVSSAPAEAIAAIRGRSSVRPHGRASAMRPASPRSQSSRKKSWTSRRRKRPPAGPRARASHRIS